MKKLITIICAATAAFMSFLAHAWEIDVEEIKDGGLTIAFEVTVSGESDGTVHTLIAAFDGVDRGDDWLDWAKWVIVDDFDEAGGSYRIDAPSEWGADYFAARFFVTSEKYLWYQKEVASLTSSGKSTFADIGYNLTVNSIVTLKASMATFNGGLFFGNFTDTSVQPDGAYWRMFPYGGTILFDLTGEQGDQRLWGSVGISANTPYVFEMGNHWLKIDGQLAGEKYVKTFSPLQQPVALQQSDWGTFYWLQIKESADGPLTADYIPVVDNDGHTALFEKVSKRIIPCTLTGDYVEFTAGEDVEVRAEEIDAIATASATYVLPSLTANNLRLKSASETNLVMSVDILSIGEDTSSCDIYGIIAGNGYCATNLVVSGVTGVGTVDFELPMLRPNSAYSVGAIIIPDVGESVELLPITTKTKRENFASGVNASDGFIQNSFGSAWNDGFAIVDQPSSAYVDGAWAAHVGNSGTSIGPNPWSGRLVVDNTKQVYSWRDHVTYGYETEMYMEAGKDYTVVINVDDNGSFWVDGREIFSINGQGSVSFADMHRGTYACTETGWHNLRLYVGNGSGGYGPYGSFYGMGWSTNGSSPNIADWHPFTNEVDNVMFRVPFKDPATLEDAIITSGGATFTVAFNPDTVGGIAKAYAFADYPGGDPATWGEPIVTTTLGETAKQSFAFTIPDGTKYVVFATEHNGFIYTTGSIPVGEIKVADESAVDVEYIQVSAVRQITAYIDVNVVSTGGADGVDVTVEYGYSPDELGYSFTTNDLASGLQTVKLGGLDPDHTYYARITSTNGEKDGEHSSVFTFQTTRIPTILSSGTRTPGVSWPGLWQAKESGGITGDVLDHSTVVRTLAPWAGNVWYLPGQTDPKWAVWGLDGVEGECGWINGYNIAYKGYVYLEANINLGFHAWIDDYVTFDFNGTRYIERSGGDIYYGTVAERGWYPIQVIFGDYSGGAGNQSQNGFMMFTDGVNWFTPVDTGSGALFRTSPGVCDGEVVSYGVTNGVLSANLSFGEWRYADGLELHIVAADDGCYDTPEEWTKDDTVATINGTDLAYSFTGLENCGIDWHFARFYLVDPVSEIWQWCGDAIYLPDASKPVLGDFTLDGKKGDTIKVNGFVSSAGTGEEATLTVFIADNEEMTDAVAWIIEGTFASNEKIDEALFTDDTTATNYLTPGTEKFVRLQLASKSGAKDVSKVKPVTLSASAAFMQGAFWASDANAFGIVGGRIGDVGAGNGEATVYFYAGTDQNNLALVDSRVVTPAASTFTFTNEFDQVNFTAYYKYIVSNACDTAFWTVDSGLMSIFVRDQYVYYWKDDVHDGAWENPANWTVEGSPRQATYPNTQHCAAIFDVDPEETNTPYRVTITNRVYVNTMQIHTAGTDITFEGNGNGSNSDFNSNSSGLYYENWWDVGYFGENLNITFKDMIFNASRIMFQNGMRVTFDNAYGYMRSDSYVEYKNNCELIVRNHSTYAHHGGALRAVGGWNFRLVIDDSTVILPSWERIYMAINAWSSGNWDIEFYGENPVLEARYYCLAYSTDNINEVKPRLIFHVPKGGYTREPIHCYNDDGWDFTTGNSQLLIEVAKDSPARASGKVVDCPLVICNAANHFKSERLALGQWVTYNTEDITTATQIRAVIPASGLKVFVR